MRTNPWILLLLCSLSFWGTSCIKDDMENCAYLLKFKYDYNMNFIDLLPEKIDKIDVFVFDENGLFVQQYSDETNTHFPKGYGMLLNLPAGKEYTFLTWAGLDQSLFDLTALIPGTTSIEDVQLKLRYREAGSSDQQLSPIWYGKLTALVPESQSGQNMVSLVKDSNKFRIALRLLPTGEHTNPPKKENIEVWIQSNNTLYDSNNNSLGSEIFSYKPYFNRSDDRGFIVELNTLRLITDDSNELIFANPKTHAILMKINLNEYLEDLKFLENDSMDLQEFLDREDEFAVIMYLSGSEDDPFASFIVEINDWVIRKQEVNSYSL